jgi:hypothetical protein
LAEALKRELPPHLAGLPHRAGFSHNVLISGFVNDEPRLYSIDLAVSPADRKRMAFRDTRWIVSTEGAPPRTPTIGLAGSGALILDKEKLWRRHVRRLVKYYDRQRITAQTVADALAAINHRVSLSLTDGTVGPKCIVAWRNRKAGVHKSGGGHQNYTGAARDEYSPSLPSIGNGRDTHALVEVLWTHALKLLEARRTGNAGPELDTAALNAAVARIPDTPDEKLR